LSTGAPLDNEDETTQLIAWVPAETDGVAELTVRVKALQAYALAARDREVGMRGELATARAWIKKIETVEPGRAFRRIDKLEEQRENLLHRLRLGSFGEEAEDEIAQLKASATWRIGRALVAPVAFVKTRVLRR